MPALPDVLGPHAQAHARADLVAGHRRGEEIAAAHAALELHHGHERRERNGAHVQHAGAVHIVELESLHQRAVGQRRMPRSRKLVVSTTASRSLNVAMSAAIAAALPSRTMAASTRCIALMAARWVSLGMMMT